jgi:hypothetical protein
MDFFFWGYNKDIVHSDRVESLPDLGRRITAAIAAVPVDVLPRVWGCSGIWFRRLQGRQWCSHWIEINGSKTWRDCLLVFVNKKCLFQNSE